MRHPSFHRPRYALLALGMLSAVPAALVAYPTPVQYEPVDNAFTISWYLDQCFNSCFTGTYSVCYGACQATWGTCTAGCDTCDAGCDVIEAGCDTTCFFAPNSTDCANCLVTLNDCRASCNACRAECDATYNSCIAPCLSAFHDCHRACANNPINLPWYSNGNVGTPWFCGAPRSATYQFGTLDYPYDDFVGLRQVVSRWDANPKTVYIASGTQSASPSGTGPVVIDHSTWIVNNTPWNGPVLITP